jgi:Immunity protein 63
MAITEERTQRLTRLRERAFELAAKIGASSDIIPPFGESRDGSYVDYDGLYRWIVRERGQEIEHRLTLDEDELMCWVFSEITFEMAALYEVGHRRPSQDSRRLLFQHQLELLAKLSPVWKTRCEQEQQEILAHAPFHDQ